jgi:hypothetical protein
MSTFAANRGRGDREIATAFENNALGAAEGQRHDRFTDEVSLYGPPTDQVPGRDHNGDIDISAGQKMLSAMSGSLLTSLIGKSCASSDIIFLQMLTMWQSLLLTSSVFVFNLSQIPPH